MGGLDIGPLALWLRESCLSDSYLKISSLQYLDEMEKSHITGQTILFLLFWNKDEKIPKKEDVEMEIKPDVVRACNFSTLVAKARVNQSSRLA